MFSQPDEVFQDLQPEGLALLGVELAGEDVVLPHGRDELSAVFRGRRDDAFIGGHDVIAVVEVEVRPVVDAGQQAAANLTLGNLYRDQFKDETKALAAYKAVIESPVVGAAKYDSVIAYAVLLAKQGDEKEAIAQLDKLRAENITSADWRCRIQQAYGDVYAALKRPDVALAAYRKALEVPDVSQYLVKKNRGTNSRNDAEVMQAENKSD